MSRLLLTDLQVGEEVAIRFDDGREWRTKVRHCPTQPGGPKGLWMAWLEGMSGCYLLDRVRRLRPGEEISPISVWHQERARNDMMELKAALDLWIGRHFQDEHDTPLERGVIELMKELRARLNPELEK